MSTKFDSIVMEAMKNRDKDISAIDALKKQITPYATKKELSETFDEIIKIDPDYIRRYLKNTSNIAYQTDIYIDSVETKNSMLYKNTFNNDSVYLNFGNGDKILVVCTDSSLASDNYDFYSDVFINGVKLRKKNYIEMPSSKVYNFKTGARRFLIDEDKIDVGDIISVVIRKEPRNKSFYTTVTVENDECKTYTVKKDTLGRYGEIFDTDEDIIVLENLLIFKKSALEEDKFFQLNTKASVKEYIPFVDSLDIKGTIGNNGSGANFTSLPTENVEKNHAYKVLTAGTYGKFACNAGDILFALDSKSISDSNNWGCIPSNYRKLLILDVSEDTVNKDDVYLIINRKKHIECEVIKGTELTEDEYIKYDAKNHITQPLVDISKKVAGCNLPLPVKSINDIEVYVDGYRLINDVDYIFVNNENKEQYIQFTGIVKPNSVITYRNKNIDDTYNFYFKDDLKTFNNYVAFNEEFQSMVSTDIIPNNTEILFLENIKCIMHKDEYNNIEDYTDNARFYRIVKDTPAARESLNITLADNPYAGKYEEIFVDDETSCFLCDEDLLFDENAFEYFNEDRYIEFTSFIQELVSSSKIILEGIKVFDGVMFTKYESEYEHVINDLIFINDSTVGTNFSYGIIDLDEYGLPISEDYIEAYLGRVRVPLCNKRSVINRYLKIDDQHNTFKDLEIYSEINWSDYAKYVINSLRYPINMLSYPNEVRNNVYSQLKQIDVNDEITNNWLVLNENKLNSDRDSHKVEDVFYGRFKKISISTTNASDQKIKQNIYPIFRVLGYYNDEEYVDITKHCTYTFKNESGAELPDFDTITVGKQYVTATFNQGMLGELISDTITMEVVAIEIVSVKIISNTNIFTLNDNIFDCIRVVGKYENGSERIITEQCALSLTNYDGSLSYKDGIVDMEGSYVIRATYSSHIYDTKTILVSSASSRKIKKLDVIPNSFLEGDDIITTLDIYATYNNDQIQKVSNDTVDIYLFKDGVLDTTPSNADCIKGLVLDTEYTLRVIVFNDTTKTGNPIETATDDYTDVTIKLLNNEIKNNYQIIYYDNLTATLDDNFVNSHKDDPNFYYYSIKNLDGIYMSIGQNVLTDNEGIMTIGALVKNEVVAVDFYNKDTQEFVQQLLFVVMDVNDSRISATGILTGNLLDGYRIAIDKLALNEEYSKIDFTNAVLKDIDGEVIVRYNIDLENKNNNYTENGIDQYIYVYFKNFKTNSGNVQAINKYIEKATEVGKMSLDLFFDINNNNKIIELHVPADSYTNSEFEYFNYTELNTKVYIDDTTQDDETWLIVEPELPDEDVSVYEIRPESSVVIDSKDTDKNSNIVGNNLKFQLVGNGGFNTHLSLMRVGLNRYCYRTINNEIYVIDIDITKDYETMSAVINTINGQDVELSE